MDLHGNNLIITRKSILLIAIFLILVISISLVGAERCREYTLPDEVKNNPDLLNYTAGACTDFGFNTLVEDQVQYHGHAEGQFFGCTDVEWSEWDNSDDSCEIDTGCGSQEDYGNGSGRNTTIFKCAYDLCKQDACPNVGYYYEDNKTKFPYNYNARTCWISYDYWHGSWWDNTNCKGKWDASDRKCVACENNKEVKVCGDTTQLWHAKDDTDDNTFCDPTLCTKDPDPPTSNCESACGADEYCDELAPGEQPDPVECSGRFAFRCSSSCEKFRSDVCYRDDGKYVSVDTPFPVDASPAGGSGSYPAWVPCDVLSGGWDAARAFCQCKGYEDVWGYGTSTPCWREWAGSPVKRFDWSSSAGTNPPDCAENDTLIPSSGGPVVSKILCLNATSCYDNGVDDACINKRPGEQCDPLDPEKVCYSDCTCKKGAAYFIYTLPPGQSSVAMAFPRIENATIIDYPLTSVDLCSQVTSLRNLYSEDELTICASPLKEAFDIGEPQGFIVDIQGANKQTFKIWGNASLPYVFNYTLEPGPNFIGWAGPSTPIYNVVNSLPADAGNILQIYEISPNCSASIGVLHTG